MGSKLNERGSFMWYIKHVHEMTVFEKTTSSWTNRLCFTKLFFLFSGLMLKLVFGASEEVVNSASFSIGYGLYPETGASISCSKHTFVQIVNASGYKINPYTANETYELTNTEIANLENMCNCKNDCLIPKLEVLKATIWTLVVEYSCKGKT